MQKNSLFNVIISDTTCVTSLSKIGKLYLLKELYGKVFITNEIFDEYKKEHEENLPDWIEIKEVKDKNKLFEINKELHLGESSAIALALENKNSLLIVDDGKARLYATDQGLTITGTIGVIKSAVEKGIIESKEKANEIFKELKNKGNFRMSKEFYEKIKYPINNIENNHKIVNQNKITLKNDKSLTYIVNSELELQKTTQPEKIAVWKKIFIDLPKYVCEKLIEVRKEIKNKNKNNEKGKGR